MLCMMFELLPCVTNASSGASYVLNDQFSSGTDGWVAGAGDSQPTLANVASYTDKDGVTAEGLLKIDFTGNGNDWDSHKNQTAHRTLEVPYVYKDNTNLVIHTRILQTGSGDASTFSFLQNKPNTAVTDTVSGTNAAPNNTFRAGAYYYNDYLLFYAKKDASNSDLRYGTGVNPKGNLQHTDERDNLTDRWIDVEMVLGGRNNRMTIKATVDGKTEYAASIDLTQDDKVYRNKYGTDANGDPNQRFFDALESLSIQQRNSSNTVYVDFVEAYEQPALINDQFTSGTDSWVAGEGASAPIITHEEAYTDKDGMTAEGLLRIDFTGTGGDWNSKDNQTAHREFVTPYTYNDDTKLIIKTRILQTGDSGTFGFLCNKPNTSVTDTVGGGYPNANPNNAIRAGAYYYNDYLLFHTKKAASGSDLRFGTNKHDLPGNILHTDMADNLTDRWINVTMVIDGKNNRMTLTATANGYTETVEEIDLTQNDAVYRNKYGTNASGNSRQVFFDALESLSIQQRNSANTVYVDYVEVYELKNRYIASFCVKKPEGVDSVADYFDGYQLFVDGNELPFGGWEYYPMPDDDEWVTVVALTDIASEEEFSGTFAFVKDGVQAEIRDAYCGILRIDDIETIQPDEVEIPESGEIAVPIVGEALFNQLGTAYGLEIQSISLKADQKGVSVSGDGLVVHSDAVTGILPVEISCVPAFPTTLQKEYKKIVEIRLTAPQNSVPKATNVKIVGDTGLGKTLTGVYDFYHVENKADASELQWTFSDSQNGVYRDIPGAVSDTFTVTEEYKDQFIRFTVLPKTEDGLQGEKVVSDAVVPQLAPTAKDIKISGDFKVGGTVRGSYTFEDINGDSEAESRFQWYTADAKNGEYTAIIGATGKELTLTEDFEGKYLKFSVTPVAETAPIKGNEYWSAAVEGPGVPYITGLKIARKDNMLYADYTYHHPHNASEKSSTFLWTVDGKTVSTSSSYIINFTGSKTVTLTVTPGTDSIPAKGLPVSVSSTIKGNTDTSGRTVGGGFLGGGSSSGGSGSVNPTSAPVTTQAPSDIDGHWGAEYIRNMASRGIMKADENGNYRPDALVTREEMLTYLFQTLDLQPTEYKGIFADVEDGEFAGRLQAMVDNGTISVDSHFRPNDNISREEMCKILCISLKNAGALPETEEGLINHFADFESIGLWARGYVNSIYGMKIMIGVSDTEFAPKGSITKAQAATLLVRLSSYIKGE